MNDVKKFYKLIQKDKAVAGSNTKSKVQGWRTWIWEDKVFWEANIKEITEICFNIPTSPQLSVGGIKISRVEIITCQVHDEKEL